MAASAFHTVALGLGSNISPTRHLTVALDALHQRYGHLQTSSVFESEAVGFHGANFLNMVVLLETEETLPEMAQFLKGIETANGRDLQAPRARGRSIDIDILLFDELQGAFGEITLPRPEITENAFVLWPLSELLPDTVLPGASASLAALWDAYDKSRQHLWPVDFSWRGRRLSSTR